ncbi:MAG: hypothetical protein QM783_02030 [Phycisphaerales bacterium]
MPFDERDIESRLEAMGRREASARVEMPAVLAGAVAARTGGVKPVVGRMPWGAVAAALAVVAAAGWVVVVRPAVMPRSGGGLARSVLPADALASIVGRYERGASIESALGSPSFGGGGSGERVERAADWRGALAE